MAERIRFDNPGGSFPLRALTPDGTEWAVNRDHEGLFSRRADGTWQQHVGTCDFSARTREEFSRKLRQHCGIGDKLGFATWAEWAEANR